MGYAKRRQQTQNQLLEYKILLMARNEINVNFPETVEKVKKYVIEKDQIIKENMINFYFFFYENPSIIYTNIEDVKKDIHLNPNYDEFNLIEIKRCFLPQQLDIGWLKHALMFVDYKIYKVDKKHLITKTATTICWGVDDFVVSKPTTQLLNKLGMLLVEGKIKTKVFVGQLFHNLVYKNLKEDISMYFNPI